MEDQFESNISLKELVIQSEYVRKLLKKEELSKIHDIIPNPLSVVEAWKLVEPKYRFEIQKSFLTFVEAYSVINHEDIDELEPFLVSIIFMKKNKRKNVDKALELLSKICNESISNTMDSMNAYHTFKKNKRDILFGIDSRFRDILYVFQIMFELLKKKPIFNDSSTEIIKKSISYVFTYKEEDEIDDEEIDFSSMDISTDEFAFTLKDVMEFCLSKRKNVQLRSSVIQLLTSMCFISEFFARKFVSVIEKEVYYQKKDLQAYALACLMDIFFMWPSLLSVNIDKEEDEEYVSMLMSHKHFINAPEKEKKLQTIFIHGLSRLLLHDCIEHDYIEGLDLLCSKYLSRYTEKNVKDVISQFFSAYNKKKMSHQKEFGNTIVSILVEDIGLQIEEDEEDDNENKIDIKMDDKKIKITEKAKKKIVFLLSFVQNQHYPKIVENAQMNLKKVLGCSYEYSKIQEWFNLE